MFILAIPEKHLMYFAMRKSYRFCGKIRKENGLAKANIQMREQDETYIMEY